MRTATSIRDIALSVDGGIVQVLETSGGSRRFVCDYVAIGVVSFPRLVSDFAVYALKNFSSEAPSLHYFGEKLAGSTMGVFVCSAEDQSLFCGPFVDEVFCWFELRGVLFTSGQFEIMSIAHLYIDHFEVLAAAMRKRLGIDFPCPSFSILER